MFTIRGLYHLALTESRADFPQGYYAIIAAKETNTLFCPVSLEEILPKAIMNLLNKTRTLLPIPPSMINDHAALPTLKMHVSWTARLETRTV